MLEKEIIEKINKVLKSALKLNDKLLSNNLIKSEMKEWDSLKHISIIANLETEFDMQFEPEEIEELNSYVKITNFIRKNLNR